MSGPGAIKSLLLPLTNGLLIVPASAVEEVLFAEPLDLPPPAAPDWLVGEVHLRQQPVPVVSFEVLTGAPAAPVPAAVHAVVLKNLIVDAEPSLYALQLLRAPRVEELDTGTLQLAAGEASENPFIACRVVVEGEEGSLPALDLIVEKLQRYFVGV